MCLEPLRPRPPARSLVSQGDGERTRARAFVRAAGIFYGAMFAAAWAVSRWTGDALFWFAAEPGRHAVEPLRDAALGLAAAAAVIAVSDLATRRTRTGAALADALAALLGRLSWSRCLVLAAASGVAEEALFRGVLQPRVGLLASAAIFGLAHFVPRRDLAPWSAFALAAGLLFGGLFEATGNLLAPVVAHAAINAVNLRLLSRRARP